MFDIPRRLSAATISVVLLVLVMMLATLLPLRTARAEELGPQHLVISEVTTGGASASDEMIELYNPMASSLPLEGLELVYVTATGATVSRRAAWGTGAASVPPAQHVLVANELGAYASIADVTYASGMAASGGSVALRIQGASTAIDSVGWGTAANLWMEGAATVAPPAGSSLERLPGGAGGSTRDTDDNVSDFAIRDVPDPQNLGSAPTPDPAASPTPTPSPIPSASPTADATPPTTPTPSSPTSASSIAEARVLPDGAEVTIEATALAGSDFTDGGGYVADPTGGIAVIVDGGSFARGEQLRLTGIVSDRFSQRTLRADVANVERLGTAAEPEAIPLATGAIDEAAEGRLARISGTVASAATTLTSGLAYDVDDGSGPIRVLVATATGIDTSEWSRGTTITVTGVVGQRDSSGTGVLGYRVQPRDAADVSMVHPSPSATPGTTDTPAPSATASPAPVGVVSVADARKAAKNTRVRVRAVVTMPTGVLDAGTAVVQDGSGAIMLRLGDEAGSLLRGALVEVDGVRSTKGGMETLRVTAPPRRLGAGTEPTARVVASGTAGEPDEATLVVVRGGLVASARTSSTGTVTFEVDDGSGPLRVSISASIGFDDAALVGGTWVEVRGILGQETTGAQPARGYRVWPRQAGDVRVLATPSGVSNAGGSLGGDGSSSGAVSRPARDLGAIGTEGAADGLQIGATLVAGPWAELGIGGLLWDGRRLVAVEPADAERIEALLGSSRPPLVLELGGLTAGGSRIAGIPAVGLGPAAEDILPGAGTVHPPATALPARSDAARWVSVVGRLVRSPNGHRLVTDQGDVMVEHACEDGSLPAGATVGALGVATPERPGVLVVGCSGFSSAPQLGRGPAIGLVGMPIGQRAGVSDVPAPAGSQPPAVLPAGLLALGSLGLVGGAVMSRRMAEGDPPDDEPDEPEGPGDTEADSVPSFAAAPPALTLVALPRERGS